VVPGKKNKKQVCRVCSARALYPQIQNSATQNVPKYSTHLVVYDHANNPKEVEHKIIYSILNKKPKSRHLLVKFMWYLDDPYTSEYVVEHIIPMIS
jgi:KUP system potassium uptake protein